MNDEIRPEGDLALRKQIERAVRPVRAGRDRKLAMREELLGHLTALYTEEFQRQPNEQAALGAALARFGEPAALTAELNTSVGFSQRLAYYVDQWESTANGRIQRWLGVRSEPWLHFALRTAWALALFNVPMLGGVALLGLFVGGWPNDFTTTALPLLGTYFLLFVISEVATLTALRCIYQTLYVHRRPWRWVGGRWAWASLQAVVWVLLSVVLTIPGRWNVTGQPPTPAGLLQTSLSSMIFAPILVGSASLLHFALQKRKKHEAWTTLAIDD